jgi:hypothetical protein
LPELEAVELVLALELVAAALEPEVALELLELDEPHAASDSATAARPATVAILPRESNPAVLLMCGAPSSASSAALVDHPVPSQLFTGAWRGDKQ